MAFTVQELSDLEVLKGLSTHIVNILDKEASIASELRQLTADNIIALNDAYSLVVENMSDILTPVPNIGLFTPMSASTAEVVTISGNNFTGATAVSFGGTPATSFTVLNSKTIQATVGAGTTGDIEVVTPEGTAILIGFTYIAP